MTTHFIPGLELCGLLYSEVIKPILDFNFPNMRYSAALIGVGSEVLGFDTEISRDHDWGPRVKLFLEESNFADEAKVIQASLQSQLPDEFRGYPVQWTHF